MQVLVCPASRPGEVFSRQALFDRVWPDTIVGDEALTRTIPELRRIFGDDPGSHHVIETIRKGGYRLIAPVTPAPVRPLDEAGENAAARTGGGPAGRRRPGLRLLVPACGVTIALLAASLWHGRSSTDPPGRWQVRPLTAYPGMEYAPAVS